MIRVQLPVHLRNLAGTGKMVDVEIEEPVTPERIVDALESSYPALLGGIRDRTTGQRRPMVRFFACEEDYSHLPTDTVLPEAVATGKEPFIILGAISGGESEPKYPLPVKDFSQPATRALASIGVTTLQGVAEHTQRELAGLHGMGPKGIRTLKAALADHGLTFANRAASATPVGIA